MITLLLAGLWGYLVGSIPAGVLVSRTFCGPNVLRSGSGHTGGMNVVRVVGLWAGALTVAVDLALGAGAVFGALSLANSFWAAAVAGVLAVVGHNWSVFIRFHGGIGLTTLLSGLLVLSPWATLAALAVVAVLWIGIVYLARVHRARATILVMVVAGPLLWALGAPPSAVLLGTLGGAAVIVKTIPDWNRRYD